MVAKLIKLANELTDAIRRSRARDRDRNVILDSYASIAKNKRWTL